jgi:hypothetical protein
MTLKELPATLVSIDDSFDELVERCLERYHSRMSPAARHAFTVALVLFAAFELLGLLNSSLA